MTDLLFVYGTLHPDRAPAEIAPTVALLEPRGPASLRGRLLDLGTYPGLILPGPDEIRGELFALPEGRARRARAWAALDAYEDFRPDAPDASLFTRVLTNVILPDGATRAAWVYLFNQPVRYPA
jgi:gamma-glutamylcyclotransferase (GGCT)/AIG2-like uncharacterized protein YtfP